MTNQFQIFFTGKEGINLSPACFIDFPLHGFQYSGSTEITHQNFGWLKSKLFKDSRNLPIRNFNQLGILFHIIILFWCQHMRCIISLNMHTIMPANLISFLRTPYRNFLIINQFSFRY